MISTNAEDKIADKKVYDRTVCFTFFGNWLESMEIMENEHSAEDPAYQLFKMIANFALYEVEPEADTTPIAKAMWPLLKREIEVSVENRKRGFDTSLPTEKQLAVVSMHIAYPDMSQRDIAAELGIALNTVHNALKKYREEPALFAGSIDVSAYRGVTVEAPVDASDKALDETSVEASDKTPDSASSGNGNSYRFNGVYHYNPVGSYNDTTETGTLRQWDEEEDLPF